METIIDILRESVEQIGLVEHLTIEYILVSLTASLLCAAIIYVVYKCFYRGAVFSENFAILLVMMTVITAFVILTISSNLVLSLGMVGALSIVRFRSAVKEPLDVGFMFWGIAAGITAGAGLYPFALVSTLFIAFVYIMLYSIGRKKKSFVLMIRHNDDAADQIEAILSQKKTKLRGMTKTKNGTELTVDICCKPEDTTFVDTLLLVPGVSSAVLVEYTGD